MGFHRFKVCQIRSAVTQLFFDEIQIVVCHDVMIVVQSAYIYCVSMHFRQKLSKANHCCVLVAVQSTWRQIIKFDINFKNTCNNFKIVDV